MEVHQRLGKALARFGALSQGLPAGASKLTSRLVGAEGASLEWLQPGFASAESAKVRAGETLFPGRDRWSYQSIDVWRQS